MVIFLLSLAVAVDTTNHDNRIVRADRAEETGGQDVALSDDDAVPANWNLLYNNQESKLLGKGTFGAAHLVTLDGGSCAGEKVVTKTVTIGVGVGVGTYDARADVHLPLVMKELEVQSAAKHPNLMGLFDYTPKIQTEIKEAKQVTIMMAPAYGGEVDQRYIENMTSAGAATGFTPGLLEALPSVLGHVAEYISGSAEDFGPRDQYAAKLLCDTASGLAALHDMGYVHRDLKPQNIWASHEDCLENKECRFMLGDYGLAAKEADAAKGFTVGTGLYMPPEVDRADNVVRKTLEAQLGGCYTGCSGWGGWRALTYQSKEVTEQCVKECEEKFDVPSTGWTKAGDVFALGQTLYYTLTSAQYEGGRFGQLYGVAPGLRRFSHGMQNMINPTPAEGQTPEEAKWAAKKEFAAAMAMFTAKNVLMRSAHKIDLPVDHRIEKLPEPLVKLLTSMLHGNAKDRPTAAAVRDVACPIAHLPDRPAQSAPACVATCHELNCGASQECSIKGSTGSCVDSEEATQ